VLTSLGQLGKGSRVLHLIERWNLVCWCGAGWRARRVAGVFLGLKTRKGKRGKFPTEGGTFYRGLRERDMTREDAKKGRKVCCGCFTMKSRLLKGKGTQPKWGLTDGNKTIAGGGGRFAGYKEKKPFYVPQKKIAREGSGGGARFVYSIFSMKKEKQKKLKKVHQKSARRWREGGLPGRKFSRHGYHGKR